MWIKRDIVEIIKDENMSKLNMDIGTMRPTAV
jgi:hypothetical protein